MFPQFCVASFSLLLTFSFIGLWQTNWVFALHESDHRFTVSGRVCHADGQGLGGVKVIVKDTKASIGGSGITDGNGFYRTKLHLHNQNKGDPLVVKALNWEVNAQVDFDAHDLESERGLTVNLGGPCSPESDLDLRWIFGIGVLVIMWIIWLKMVKSKKTKSSGINPRAGKSKKGRM